MRASDLTTVDHPVLVFLQPTTKRINNSVAWRSRCKACGKESLVGAAQIKRKSHNTCVHCTSLKELDSRKL